MDKRLLKEILIWLLQVLVIVVVSLAVRIVFGVATFSLVNFIIVGLIIYLFNKFSR